MASNYTEFDAALLAHIAAGRNVAHMLLKQRDLLTAGGAAVLGQCMDRVIDRRLQALRAAGQIRFNRKAGWQIVKQAAGERA